MSDEEEMKHEWTVFVEPWNSDVGDVLDAYLICTNSVFVLAAYSLITVAIHCFIHGATPTEQLEILIDIATIITGVISIKVAFTGSIPWSAVVVGTMILRFASWILICYLVCEDVYHKYYLFSKINMVFSACLSFLTLTYYTVYMAKLIQADEQKTAEGRAKAKHIRKNRKECGKAWGPQWVSDIMNMSEYDLIADYVLGHNDDDEADAAAKDYGSTK